MKLNKDDGMGHSCPTLLVVSNELGGTPYVLTQQIWWSQRILELLWHGFLMRTIELRCSVKWTGSIFQVEKKCGRWLVASSAFKIVGDVYAPPASIHANQNYRVNFFQMSAMTAAIPHQLPKQCLQLWAMHMSNRCKTCYVSVQLIASIV